MSGIRLLLLFYKLGVSAITEKQPKKYRSITCPSCQEPLDRNNEEFTEHSKKYYHRSCFRIHYQKTQNRKDLIDYACKLHNIKHPGVIVKQIKEFEDDYGYTLKGIELALRYFHEILGNPVDRMGIGIVPWIYEDAKRHYKKIAAISKSAQDAETGNRDEIIHIELSNKKKIAKHIDIEGL